MSIFEAIILGIVQGLTEFLPISSSGHLILTQKLMGIEGDLLFFDLVLHLGTLFAVCFVLKNQLLSLIKKPDKRIFLLAVATLPTIIIYMSFKSFFRAAFSGQFLAVGFILSAVIILIADLCSKFPKPSRKNCDASMPPQKIGFYTAVIMGIAQGAAVLPALSRSGTTVSSALIVGADKKEAAEFSFLMSIPIILGSIAMELPETLSQPVSYSPLCLILGLVSSAVFGFLAVKFMISLITKRRLYGFSFYLLIPTVAALLLF